jgi:glycosyltransferase involved in cell wall biosynthesis
MKKILFLIPNLKHGGAEKVLVNLVNNLDKDKYEVTLYSIFDEGINKEFLNDDVNYIYKFKKVFRGNTLFFNLFSPKFLYNWFVKAHYDIVVSFLEGPTARIVAGCEHKTIKKICWIHTDFLNAKLAAVGFRNFKEAKKLYNRFYKIIGVSNNVVNSFERLIQPKVQTQVLYNVNETDQIRHLANEEMGYKFTIDTLNICTVGKITNIKGFNRLIEVHKKLIDEGYKLKTHVLGIGEEMATLKKRVKELHISDTFIFLGFDKNPYKYLSKSDLYVCSSYREGFSTAVTEALVLGIPVVSTKVSGADELLGDTNEFGIVTVNSTEGIYDGLKEMISKHELLSHYKKQAELRGSFFSKENTVKAVDDFFNEL